MNHLRKEASHRRRLTAFQEEQTAVSDPPPTAPDAAWIKALPHLDEAMNALPEADRTAVLLRFYSGRSFPEIGSAMGRTEEAARKLCSRALEKLSARLRRRGVALGATALAAGWSSHGTTVAAAMPPGLVAGISSHVAAQLALPAASVTASGGLLAFLTAMKPTTTLITAAALLAIAIPAAWQWQELRAVSTRTAARPAEANLQPGPLVLADGKTPRPGPPSSYQPSKPGALSSDAITSMVNRLLALKKGNHQGDYDIASVMEMELLTRQMKDWDAPAIRTAMDLLLNDPGGGKMKLELAENLLDTVYSEKAPAAATALAFTLVDRDPLFQRAALWSMGQWFGTDPASAAAWVAEQDAAGALESSGIQERKRRLVEEGKILGLAWSDPAAARTVVAKADPAISQSALAAFLGRLPDDAATQSFLTLAAAIPDPARAGNLIGNWTKTGRYDSRDLPGMATLLTGKLPANLPPAVRRAAVIEGSQVAGNLRDALGIVGHAAAPADRTSMMAELAAQFLTGSQTRPQPAWLDDAKGLAPFRDEAAAATALALGLPGLAGAIS